MFTKVYNVGMQQRSTSRLRVGNSTSRLLNLKTPTALLLAFVVLFSYGPSSVFGAFGGGEPTVLTANPFSDQSTNLKVDGPTGAFTQRIPIVIPPGRNGMQPDIALEYNSQRTEDSMVGYGWSLSVPYIQRLNKTGSQDLYTTSTVFTSSLDGELAKTSATSSQYRARIESVSANTYFFANNTWTVFDKKGTRYIFGSSDSGRQYDVTSGSSESTFKWMLQEVRDTNGNFISYSYLENGNELYPYQIKYTGYASTDGSFLVAFSTSTRSDVRESYKPGFKATLNFRISQIDISVSGTLVNRYTLSYGTGTNGKRSLLSSVQQTGYDESGGSVTPPAVTFTYANSSAAFVSQSNGTPVQGPAYVVADTNGNGINDINRFVLNGGTNTGEFYLDQANTNTTNVSEYWADNANSSGHLAIENGVRYFDVNGDGKADIVKSFQNDQTGTIDKKIYEGSGSLSFSTTTNYTGMLPDFGRKSGGTIFTTGLFGEVNGDGFPDYVKAVSGYGGGYTFTGNGSAFATSSVFFPLYQLPSVSYTLYSSSQLVDINGDGLDDWVHSDDSTTYVHLNNGRGWGNATSTQWGIATSTYYKSTSGADTQYYDRGIRFVDINGDGLADFVRSYSMVSNSACTGALPEMGNVKQVFLNTGNGWATTTAYAPGYIVNGWINTNGEPCGMTGVKRNELVNWTGNGQMMQDVITSVTYPQGGTRTVTYTPSAQLGTNPNLPTSLLVVTALAENDGFGTIGTTTYAYGGGKIYLASTTPDRRFAGFSVSTTTSPDSITSTYFHQGTGLNTLLGELTNGFAHINRPFRKDVFDLSGALKQRTLYRWDSFAYASSTFIGLGREMNFDYDSLGDHKDRATEYVYASSTNDVLKAIEYGEVTGALDGSLTDLLTDKRITEYLYAATTTATTTTSSGGGASGNSNSLDLEKDSSQYMSAADSASLSPTGSITLESWIKLESKPADGQDYVVIGKHETSSNKRSYQLGVVTTEGTKTRVFMNLSSDGGGANIQYKTSSTQLSTGVWTHIAGVYDVNAHSITLYVNGVDAGAADQAGNISSIYNSSYGLGVGARNIGGTPSHFFDGIIDDVRIWNIVRSGSDILNATTTELTGSESNLNAYWKLNNNANDGTANSNTLSPTGSVTYPTDTPFSSGGGGGGTSTTTSTFTLISVPSQETLTNQSGTTIKQTKFFYDSLPHGSVNIGNLTKRDTLISGSTFASEQNAYNAYGLVASTTDPRGNVTSFTYDSRNLYRATTTNALSQSTHAYFDYTLGKPKQTIDANGLVFETVYDGLDRPITEKQPDLTTPSTLVTKKTYAYTDTVGLRKVLETNHLDGSTDFTIHKYLDGFDRVIQTRKEAEDSNKFSVKDIVYNSSGLVDRESLPYFSTGSSKTSATSTSHLYSRYTYDALKRLLTAANSVGTTTTAYEAWSATTTDANGNPKGLVYDAFKQLAKVIEYESGTPYTTQYEYDTLGSLTKITDASANVRNFTYDARGKRLTAEDIHNPADGTYGTWSYSYDVAGNLATTTDPKGQVVDYLYDPLNRVLSENYTSASGNEVEYQYDFCTYGIGKMCTATSTGATTKFTYNSLGLPATEKKTIENVTYTTAYTYNRQGNQTNILYPDSSEVQYTFNTAGLLESVLQKEYGGSFSDIVSDFDYGPHEKMTFKALANGLNTRYTYAQNELYRLRNIYTTTSASLTEGGGEFAALFGKYKNFATVAKELPLAIQGALQYLTELMTDAVFTESEVSGGEVLGEVATSTEELAHSEQEQTPNEEMTLQDPVVIEDASVASSTDTETISSILEDDEVASSTLEVKADIASTSPKVALRSLLENKTSVEKANIKAQGIVDEISKKELKDIKRESYDLEIVHIEKIEDGVQAFVRAWTKDGKQVGFGLAGEVDIERFRVFNPPILIPDPDGDIEERWIDRQGVEHINRYREDPTEALLQVLEDTIRIKTEKFGPERIEKEKVGKTTSIFYPSGGEDGYIGYGVSNWSTTRNASAGTELSTADTGLATYGSKYINNGNYGIFRTFLRFNTAGLPDSDSVSSATVSLYASASVTGAHNEEDGRDYFVLATSTAASDTTLTTDDYDQVGGLALSSLIDGNTLTASAYNDFSLNTAGRNEVSTTGYSKFSLREGHDFENDTPNAGEDVNWYGNWFEPKASESTGTTNDPKLTIEHTASSLAPDSPTSLLVEGQSSAAQTPDPTPEFSAIFNDPNAGDYIGWYQIQVATDTTFATPTWDSGKTTYNASTTVGARTSNISYAGTALSSTTPYFFRIKFWDAGNHESAWSSTSRIFSLEGTNPTISSGIQDITYTYDAVGNITQIADTSNTQARNTTAYAYDTLYRLTSAITTVASTSPYGQTYAYDPLGNITYRSDVGSYLYQGTTTGSYANSHAPTLINNLAVSYDRNGNMTNFASTTNFFDYRNRMIYSYASSSPTSIFNTYDHTEQRMTKWVSGVGTTTYPSRLYTTQGATSTISKSIYAGGELILTIKGSGTGAASTTKEYIHLDHLGSTNVTTSAAGTVQSAISYYPFGGERVTTASSTTDRHYIGERTDSETGQSYLNNRYYEAGRGQFLSQDPVFWTMGTIPQNSGLSSIYASNWNGNLASGYYSSFGMGRNTVSSEQAGWLVDPQSQNAYGYARDNPIRFKDVNGLAFAEASVNVSPPPPIFLTASSGFRADGIGLVWFISGGVSIGASHPIKATISSGNLSHKTELTVSREFELYAGAGMGISTEGVFDPRSPLSTGKYPSTSYSTGAGLGGGLSQQYTFSVPVISWSSLVNSIISSNAGGSSRLPSTVTQNGTTYYRTKDGLLSTSPQKSK